MKYFIAGGAGFIGSHVAHTLFREEEGPIVVYDNFSSGRRWHLEGMGSRLSVVKGDIRDPDSLERAMRGAHRVYHFASNPDIAKAQSQPDVDFWEGTYLTSNILEAMRKNGVRRLIYASGSGIYGDAGHEILDEDYSPLRPISTYGASKLSCEALICAYCHMFDMHAAAFRFANVVGPRQTHGVAFDFIRRLRACGHELAIRGDGTQSKSYIHVDDVVSAMRLIEGRLSGFSCYNVATEDWVSVKEIADTVAAVMGLSGIRYHFSGGDRGWRGDVPVVRLDSTRIRTLGWANRHTSAQAVALSAEALYRDSLLGRFDQPPEES